MDYARKPAPQGHSAEVVDFDDALFDSFAPELRGELMAEAHMLAQAFAPEGRAEELDAMALALSLGKSDGDMDRQRARGLAAALRRLAKDPWGA
jgi:hypothetical protein